jgi:hypothetical protein
MGFGWEKNDFRSKNADLWKRLLVIYRNHQVEWIKGTITRRMNVVMYFAVNTKYSVVNRCFYEREEEKFYENFASLNRCNSVTYKLPLRFNSKLIK